MKFSWVIFCCFLLCLSCSRDKGPIDVLNDFIDYRFSKNQSITELMEMTTGTLYNDLNSLVESAKEDSNKKKELENFLDVSNKRKKYLKINLKECNDYKCYVTYTMKYDRLKTSKKIYSVEVKTIAEILKESNIWKISSINNIKTHIDSKEKLDVKSRGNIVVPEY